MSVTLFSCQYSTVLYTDGELWLLVCVTVRNINLALTVRLSFCSAGSTVQCCINSVCCGFQFLLLFGNLKLLLQYVCHLVQVRVQCSTVQYNAVYRVCVLAFSLLYSLKHLTSCYSMSVIYLADSTVKYSRIYQSTVQCCIQTVSCGFQLALQLETFNLLLQYVFHFFS